jgi:hypothetical protein
VEPPLETSISSHEALQFSSSVAHRVLHASSLHLFRQSASTSSQLIEQFSAWTFEPHPTKPQPALTKADAKKNRIVFLDMMENLRVFCGLSCRGWVKQIRCLPDDARTSRH